MVVTDVTSVAEYSKSIILTLAARHRLVPPRVALGAARRVQRRRRRALLRPRQQVGVAASDRAAGLADASGEGREGKSRRGGSKGADAGRAAGRTAHGREGKPLMGIPAAKV